MPAVRKLEEKYSDSLVVIGVHSGKFITERETANIRAATSRLGIDHPVLNDHQFRTWRAFNVSAWPTLVLVGPDGNYIGQHAGEITFDMFDPTLESVTEAYSQAGLLDRTPMHFTPDPEPQTDSPLYFPGKVLADPTGNRLFIADTGNNRVLVTRPGDGASATIVQTIGTGQPGFRDGPFAEAALHRPEGMTLTLRGSTLYIADTENHAIRAANLDAATLKTIAGTGDIGYSRTGGPGTSTALNSPWDLLEHDGYLYIAMAGTHQLWRMDLASGEVQPFAGSGRENVDDGPNPQATLAQPSGLTTDGQRLFFADGESSAVRAADFAHDGYVQTFLGEGLFEFGDRDGKAMQVRLQHCLGVAYHNGKVYIADTYNNKIKTYDLATKQCVTSLGSGDPTDLYEPGGLSVWANDTQSRLYVADTNNHTIVCSAILPDGSLQQPPTHLRIT